MQQSQPNTGPASSHCYAGFSPEFVDMILEREEARQTPEVRPEASQIYSGSSNGSRSSRGERNGNRRSSGSYRWTSTNNSAPTHNQSSNPYAQSSHNRLRDSNQSHRSTAVSHEPLLSPHVSHTPSIACRTVPSALPTSSTSVRTVNPYAGFSGPLVRENTRSASQTSSQGSSSGSRNLRGSRNVNRRSGEPYRWTASENSLRTGNPGSNPYATSSPNRISDSNFPVSDIRSSNTHENRTDGVPVSANTQNNRDRQSYSSNTQGYNQHNTVANPYANSSHLRQSTSNYSQGSDESHSNTNNVFNSVSMNTNPLQAETGARNGGASYDTGQGTHLPFYPGATDGVFHSAQPVSGASVNPPLNSKVSRYLGSRWVITQPPRQAGAIGCMRREVRNKSILLREPRIETCPELHSNILLRMKVCNFLNQFTNYLCIYFALGIYLEPCKKRYSQVFNYVLYYSHGILIQICVRSMGAFIVIRLYM